MDRHPLDHRKRFTFAVTAPDMDRHRISRRTVVQDDGRPFDPRRPVRNLGHSGRIFFGGGRRRRRQARRMGQRFFEITRNHGFIGTAGGRRQEHDRRDERDRADAAIRKAVRLHRAGARRPADAAQDQAARSSTAPRRPAGSTAGKRKSSPSMPWKSSRRRWGSTSPDSTMLATSRRSRSNPRSSFESAWE